MIVLAANLSKYSTIIGLVATFIHEILGLALRRKLSFVTLVLSVKAPSTLSLCSICCLFHLTLLIHMSQEFSNVNHTFFAHAGCHLIEIVRAIFHLFLAQLAKVIR